MVSLTTGGYDSYPFATHRRVRHRPIAVTPKTLRFGGTQLPAGSIREFRKAVDDAHPLWAKFYMWLIGASAWTYLAYRAFTHDLLQLRALDKVALATFVSAVIVQKGVLFRAFWRNDIVEG